MECKNCKYTFTHNFDKFSIQKTGRCSKCQIAWQNLPENNPEFNQYRITFQQEPETVTIFAKTEEEALEQFGNEYDSDDIIDVEEVKRKSKYN